MHLLSVAFISGFILGTSTLNLVSQDSVATFSNVSSSSFELLPLSNQSTSWSNNSFTPARPPSLAANSSALQTLGLIAEEPTTWLKTASGDVVGVQCNVRYGRRLDYQDCRDAHNYIPRMDHTIKRFAWRRSGFPHEIALPLRALGSKGKCAIDSILVAPYEEARASVSQVSEAAYALIERCAPRSGGIAVNIGGDDRLAVTLSPYVSRVECDSSRVPFNRESCAIIERGMQADGMQLLWGDQSQDPRVEEQLPYELISTDEGCSILISSNGGEVRESWYNLWEATVALSAVCVRAQKQGKVTGLGAGGNMQMEIANRPFPLSSLGLVNLTAIART